MVFVSKWMDDMVAVPAGEFLMGCNDAVDSACYTDEKPGRKVHLDSFYIDRHEVTVADFARCVATGRCVEEGIAAPGAAGGQGGAVPVCNWKSPGRDRHPINCITWQQAVTYCDWAGKRLPTEAEWEKAARGVDGLLYPWGNDIKGAGAGSTSIDGGATPDTGLVFTADTHPVESEVANKSPFGMFDALGNTWEWVTDWYAPAYYKGAPVSNPKGPAGGKRKVAKGGSFHREQVDVRLSVRLPAEPNARHPEIGFRCAR
jgi:iron(II)-dependent oxidoreductase